MKKYLVIGNPIKHSLSPTLHNHWIKKNKIDAKYEKKELHKNDLKYLVDEIRNKKLDGINVTIPFKKEIIPYLDKLTYEAKNTQSVNTIYYDEGSVVGHNTDISGFELAINKKKYDIAGKKILILGAGGVVPSIIYALYKMKASNIVITNRTKSKSEELKNLFKNLEVLNWGEISDFDMIINATSIGLKDGEKINLDFSKLDKNKFFFDIIYNPKETNFLKTAKKLGNYTTNGIDMFVYQAAEAFKIWHGIEPEINNEIYELLNQ
tara:strand:+ start:162 stop:956 length:795 start_codon:yes stop_codon:yes gene_type:complete